MKQQIKNIALLSNTEKFLENIDPEQLKKQKVFIASLQHLLKFNEMLKEKEIADSISSLLLDITKLLGIYGKDATLKVGEFYELGEELFKG